MSLDTRFRRAGEGVRTSARGVDSLTQLSELKQEHTSRRRTSVVAGTLGAAAVLGVGAWFGASIVGLGTDPAPAGPIDTPTDGVFESDDPQPGAEVGSGLPVNLTATVPEGWEVAADSTYVELVNDGMPHLAIRIGGPIESVWDFEGDKAVDLPPSVCDNYPERCPSYADWLRTHKALTLLDDGMVHVDGLEIPQLQLRVNDNAPVVERRSNGSNRTEGLRLAGYVDAGPGWPAWPLYERGQIFTVTIIELNGQTYVVEALGAEDDVWQMAQLDVALDLVVDTMEVPKP